MKKLLAVLMAAIMLFALCACQSTTETTVAEDDLKYVKDKGELIIGITYFAPMNYMDENDELTGFETDFAKAVCEKLGVEAKFQEINWDSKEMELSGKTIDCIWNGMTITDERKANMSVTNPYMENKQVMIAKRDVAAKYAESIEGAAVVAEQGSAGETLAAEDEFFAGATFTPVDSQTKALMEVLSGTADIAVVDYVLSIGSIGEGTDFADLVVVEGKDFSPEQYGIAFRKGSNITEEVNSVIKGLIEDGTLDSIAAKYKLDALLVK